MTEEPIAAFAGQIDVFGAEGTANPFLRDRSGVDGVVNKPSPVIIPEMMVWIGGPGLTDVKRSEGDHGNFTLGPGASPPTRGL